MTDKLTHINKDGNPYMVDVGSKRVTNRVAVARAVIVMDDQIMKLLSKDELHTKKGPVFQTAILAGIMGAKKTSELIPLCHPLGLDKCQLEIKVNEDDEVEIYCTARIQSKTGVEMEALTGASVAALTIYDMCKGMSHNIVIKEIRLIKKSGGKSDYVYTP